MNNSKSSSSNTDRIRSIDIFRGLTIFLMIFVNDLPSVTNIPKWLKHMPMDQNGMTLPDIVFPAFLFIVGMSIPLAIQSRMSKGTSTLHILKHILIRSFALIILGVLMVNISSFNQELSILSRELWTFLLFIAVILLWNIYPKSKEKLSSKNIMKGFGLIILLFLVIIFRGGSVEDSGWLTTSWWGILGLIGWAYLISCIIYLTVQDNIAKLIISLLLFLALYIGDKSGILDFLVFNKTFLLIGPHLAGHAIITVSGIILTVIFKENSFLENYQRKIKTALIVALIYVFIGFCFEPVYGIYKIQTTPSFVFYSSALCIVAFCFLYWVVDIKKKDKIFNLFNPAGENPLLAYILPSIFYSALVLTGISKYIIFWRDGNFGVLRSLLFTFLILGITNILTKINIRLKL